MLSADAGATPPGHRSRSSPQASRNRTRRCDVHLAAGSFTRFNAASYVRVSQRITSVFRMQFSKSKNLGGADRDRTDDIQLAKLALSQLSYSPKRRLPRGHRRPETNGGPR